MELLAPAGSPTALKAAVQNGANAVYLGEKSLSARKNAVNFDENELIEAVKYCHARDVKVYVTLNTLVSDKEIKEFERAVKIAAKAGVDAILVQDLGCVKITEKICPDMPLHASTQMSAHSIEDVEFLLKHGISRVVLARELTFEEIENIYNKTKAELEVFVHGALCVSFSGACLMSSFIGKRSGNRGECAQPCRQMYNCGGKNGYFLSTKDLCLLKRIETLRKIGVASLKIEGRMKSPEYVAQVTGMYRKYLDSKKCVANEDIEELKKVFVRGDEFTEGFFTKNNAPEMMNYKKSNDDVLKKADKSTVNALKNTYKEGIENVKIPVSTHFTMKQNLPVTLTVTDGKNTVKNIGAVPETAITRPLDADSVKKNIDKMGGYPFYTENFSSDIDDGLIVKLSDINGLRRKCLDKLLKIREKAVKYDIFEYEPISDTYSKDDFKISVSVLDEKQFYASFDSDIIYLPLSLAKKVKLNEKCVIMLPRIVPDTSKIYDAIKEYKDFTFLASTVGEIEILRNNGIKFFTDFYLSVHNSESAKFLENEGAKRLTLSPELNISQSAFISKHTNAKCDIIAYGKIPVMTSRVCLIKGANGRCLEKSNFTDKTGAVFTAFCDKEGHTNIICNSKPIFCADKMTEIRNSVDGVRLIFTDENEDKVKSIISMYKGKKELTFPKEYTRGYLK